MPFQNWFTLIILFLSAGNLDDTRLFHSWCNPQIVIQGERKRHTHSYPDMHRDDFICTIHYPSNNTISVWTLPFDEQIVTIYQLCQSGVIGFYCHYPSCSQVKHVRQSQTNIQHLMYSVVHLLLFFKFKLLLANCHSIIPQIKPLCSSINSGVS